MAVKSLKNSTIESFANYSSSMNAGYSFQDFELIESVFVASNTASITFNNLNQYATEYKHLQIRGTLRTTHGTSYDLLRTIFNGDTGSNYASHALYATYAGSVTSINESNVSGGTNLMICAGSTNTSGYFTYALVDILDAFNANKNKVTKSYSGLIDGNTNRDLRFTSGLWMNTNPITSINIYSIGGSSFVSGSRLSLYGIR